jgi:putative ABC transport system permease protein
MPARIRSFIDVVLRRARFERDMRDEMRFHLETRADDLERAGFTRDEALRRARLEFGTIESAKEDCRQARGVRFLDELAQDLRYALRLIRKAPGFTAAAVLSLGLGIGANTAIFSLMDAVMLRTLPVVQPHNLRFVGHGRDDRPGTMSNYPLFERYRALASVFSGVTAFTPAVFKMMTAEGLENVTGLWVSGNFHGVLGVPVTLGRGFGADDDRNTASPPVAVISDSFWTRRLGRDPSVLGRTLTLNGRIVTIVGVTPARFSGMAPGSNPDLTLPLFVRALDDPEYLAMHDTWTDLTIVARLNASATESEALAATDAVFQQYMSQPENSWIRKYAPDNYAKAILLPAAKGTFTLRRQYETALTVLMGMVAVVLLIASVNVANLLLVRSTTRAKEVAIRLCVGGARSRLIRQFLTESVLLAACGGALGILIANWGATAIMHLFSAAENRMLLDVSLNARVLAFTSIVSAITGIAFGIVPAVKATRVDLTPALKDAAVFPAGTRKWPAGHVLVTTQVAMSVLVLAVAGLLVRSLHNLKSLDAGFTKDNLLLFTLDTNSTPIPGSDRVRVYSEVIERVRALPGVLTVSGSTSSPIHTGGNSRALVMPPSVPENPETRGAFNNLVTPDYFATLGIDLLRGRAFTAQDSPVSQKVAVINQTMARFYFADRDPLGEAVRFVGDPKQPFVVVGIVEDTHQMNLRDAPIRTVYTPLMQTDEPPSAATVEVRTVQDAAKLAPAVRDVVRTVSQHVVLRYVRTMDQQIDASLVRERLLAMLSSGFALLALVLSAIGLYGVMSYSVSRRAREIGIRMALGAARGSVLWQFMRQAIAVSLAGVIVGVVAALLTTKTLATFLFGLSAHDPLTLGAVCVLLLGTSLAAGVVPARRAASVDPARAIRAE